MRSIWAVLSSETPVCCRFVKTRSRRCKRSPKDNTAAIDFFIFPTCPRPTQRCSKPGARRPWIAQFDIGIFSGRVNMTKPDPEIYEEAERRFDLNPAQTLFLNDSPPNVHAA